MRSVRLVAVTGILSALLAGCGAPQVSAPAASAKPAAVASASASPMGPTQADLVAVLNLLYPASPTGPGDCTSGGSDATALRACPVTQRLAAALAAALARPNIGANPVCGCQAIDTEQTATYSPGVPPGAGTIHVTAFGSPHIAYVVISSGGRFLVDDIIYCTPSPHSIYAGETATAC